MKTNAPYIGVLKNGVGFPVCGALEPLYLFVGTFLLCCFVGTFLEESSLFEKSLDDSEYNDATGLCILVPINFAVSV